MIKRKFGYLETYRGAAPAASQMLHERGFVVLPQVYSDTEVAELAGDIERVFRECPRDGRPSTESTPGDDLFRYEMLNRSAVWRAPAGGATVWLVVVARQAAGGQISDGVSYTLTTDLQP